MNKDKEGMYNSTVYTLEEELKCYMVELDELTNQETTTSLLQAYRKGQINTCADTLFFLTEDPKWTLPKEELKKLLLPDE